MFNYRYVSPHIRKPIDIVKIVLWACVAVLDNKFIGIELPVMIGSYHNGKEHEFVTPGISHLQFDFTFSSREK